METKEPKKHVTVAELFKDLPEYVPEVRDPSLPCVACGQYHIVNHRQSGPRQRGVRLKLTPAQFDEICLLRQETGLSYKLIGEKYGITTQQAYNICKGKYYGQKL